MPDAPPGELGPVGQRGTTTRHPHFAEPDAAAYRDDAYWEELNRRSLLVRRRPMDPALRSGQ